MVDCSFVLFCFFEHIQNFCRETVAFCESPGKSLGWKSVYVVEHKLTGVTWSLKLLIQTGGHPTRGTLAGLEVRHGSALCDEASSCNMSLSL